MKQSRVMSILESVLSTAIGFAVALATQLLVFPLFGFNPSLPENLAITCIFTVVSIIRQFGVRRLFEALHIRVPISPAAKAIIAERQRQIDVEGWDAAHDDKHERGELARAGAAYIDSAVHGDRKLSPPYEWPWEQSWWKPQDFRRDLVRAGALIVAELDRDIRNRRRTPKSDPLPLSLGAAPGPNGFVPLRDHVKDQIDGGVARSIERSGTG